MQRRRPVMLMIMDGWGWRDEVADNAVRQARTPNFDRLWASCPHALLVTSGKDVGLPPGQMGNSEVGHLNIGAGRVVMQDLPRIGEAIASGEIEQQPALQDFIARLKGSGGACHLMGLVSPGGVHSHQDHAVDLAKIIADAGIPVFVHIWTDGRDTPPQSAGDDVARFLAALPREVAIATVCGRYYAMDRDKRWERVAKAYAAMVDAEGPRFADASAVIADAYGQKKFDEFIIPAVIGDYAGMRDGDGILSFNFRADRVREILGRHARSGIRRLSAPAHRQVRSRGRHDAIQRSARQVHAVDLSAAIADKNSRRGRRRRRPHAASHGGDREISARHLFPQRRARGAAFPARTASWCPRPRWRPTICSRKCRRRN